jgi:16S rRNA (adenine1518-N6/adenine1519-N6)-dimethyltransferase
VARRIVEAARIGPEDLVIEIGPGRGALTQNLVTKCARIVAIEMDPGLAQGMADRFDGGVEVVEADVLSVSFDDLLTTHDTHRAILVANIPYRITGRLINHVLKQSRCWRHAVLMIQREVGDRLVAEPGGKDYSLLTISVGLRAQATHLFDVGPGAFSPPPKVHSSVVRLTFEGYRGPEVRDEDLLFKVARTCFQRRRKMIRSSLAGITTDVEAVLEAAAVQGTSRPETLSIDDFERICRALEAHRGTCVDD